MGNNLIALDGLSYYLKYLYEINHISWDGLYDYYDVPAKAIAIGSYYFNIKSGFVFPHYGLTDLIYLFFSVFPTGRIYLLKNEFPFYKLILANLSLPYCELSININELAYADLSPAKCGEKAVFLISRPNSIFGFSADLASIESLLKKFPDTLIIVDEAYQAFSAQNSVISLINQYKNLVCLRTASKEFSIPAIRLAWLFTQNELLLSLLSKRTYNTVSRLSEIFIEELVLMQRKKIIENIVYIINERKRIEQNIKHSLCYGESQTSMVLIKTKFSIYDKLKEACFKQGLQPLFLNDLEIYKQFMTDDGNYYVRFNVWSERVNSTVIEILNGL